ncbi:hypothetical protein F2Q68_00027941 [Brassica cretica]|uniref:Uncharacterized protein n=1 Tax=Brassica cretica TaxID=69181 RepID=A0A8S9I8D0_BRACR|nr:hypothetical protein F2Q68_00027941 [Brassica cretica]
MRGSSFESVEDDDEAVDPPIAECTDVHDGVGADDEFVDPRRCTPPKQNRVIKDSEEFVDPPVTQSTQVHGGESFMRGIQVLEMYGYNYVDLVFDEMREICFELPENTKEDSDIYVGRLFKDKAQVCMFKLRHCKCMFKLRHCKRFITVKLIIVVIPSHCDRNMTVFLLVLPFLMRAHALVWQEGGRRFLFPR